MRSPILFGAYEIICISITACFYCLVQVGVQSNLFCGVHCSQTVSNGKLVSIATHSDKVKTKALESNKTLI